MFLQSLVQIGCVLPLLWPAIAAQSTTACNNSPSLCSRPYNNITYLGAHDSAFLRDHTTGLSSAGNQYYNSTVQLAAGVRLLTAQVHKTNGSSGADQWHLCHTTCDLLDAGTLTSWLAAIKSWMDANPNEVVTLLLVNSDNAAATDLGPQFASAGIDKYAYKPASSSATQTWPTLQSLISNGTRLVTFVASMSAPSPQYPYLMDEFTYVFENQFENTSPTNYSCQPDRPAAVANQPAQAVSSGRMFLMNHFLDSASLFGLQTPNDTYAGTTNAQSGVGSLGEQMGACSQTYSKPPNFVLVDFFNVGPAMASVDAANGVSGATGRQSVSTEALGGNTSAGARVRGGGSALGVVVAVVAALWFGL